MFDDWVGVLCCRVVLSRITEIWVVMPLRCGVDSTVDMVMMGTTGFRCQRWVGLCTAAGTKSEEIEDVRVPRFVVI